MAKNKLKPRPAYTSTDEDARQDIGDLTQLTTTAKDNLVEAVNELNVYHSGLKETHLLETDAQGRTLTAEEYYDGTVIVRAPAYYQPTFVQETYPTALRLDCRSVSLTSATLGGDFSSEPILLIFDSSGFRFYKPTGTSNNYVIGVHIYTKKTN